MIVGTSNIKDNPDMADWQVRADIREIKDWKRWTVLGWQEIGDPADHHALEAIYAPSLFHQLYRRRELAVTVRNTWQVLSHDWTQTHAGMAGVSPDRGYTTTVLRNRITRRRVGFVNTHLVSGAWYGEHDHQAWRQVKWNEHWAAMAQHVRVLNAMQLTTVVVGDFNRHRSDMKPLVPGATWAAYHGYDHIIVCPAAKGLKVRVAGHGAYPGKLNTDHQPVFADLRFHR